MEGAARKLEDALELAELAEELFEQQLRRAHPEASDTEIERWILEWLADRPGARDGDAVGRKVALPSR